MSNQLDETTLAAALREAADLLEGRLSPANASGLALRLASEARAKIGATLEVTR